MPKTGKIYTKKGDGGETGTFLGRMPKSDPLAEALGSVDELNSWIGVCRYQWTMDNGRWAMGNGEWTMDDGQWAILDKDLKRVQTNLMTIGSMLAGSRKEISNREIKRLENEIDRMTEELPRLSNFIYPIGQIQLARAVCRRVEREVVRLANVRQIIILKYLNRLSDYLFTLARWVNFKNGVVEEVWKG